MKVGDLVKYVSPGSRWEGAWTQPGIVLRCIPGTDERKVVRWVTGVMGCYPARNLEVLNESR